MPQKQKLSAEEKVQAIREYLTGGVGITEAARKVGCYLATFQEWVVQYEAEGIDAFLLHEKNRVYSVEVKEAAVQAYLSGEGSLMNICKKYNIRTNKLLRNWIKVYNAHGDLNSVKHSGGGSYMRKSRSTTQDERIQIAKECIASGKSYGEMALKHNVSYQQVRTWTLRFEDLGEAGLEDRRGQRRKDQAPRTELEQAQIEIEQLKHKLYLAEMENALLKKLDEVERRDAYHK